MAETDTWQDALTRRLRALLRTAPLHRTEATKAHRAASLDEQDLRALALRAIDLTIEAMGLGAGISAEELREGLRPVVLLAQPELAGADAEAVAELVIEALLNEGGRRQAFDESYLALDGEGAARKVLSFHLLRERATAEGEPLIYATTEAINLYAGMLEYPVEDAQIAEEAVLQAQVRRGRIADAVRTAQRARLRSIEYEQKIVGMIETTRRDIHQVDWVAEVLALLDAARQHLSERIEVEREIARAVERRFDAELETPTAGSLTPAVKAPALEQDHDAVKQLVLLRDSLAECINRHLRLHERLIGANRTYLEEQERQAFEPPMAEPLPALEVEVFRPALLLPCAALAAQTDRILTLLHRPHVPLALRFSQLVERLLAPRQRLGEEPYAFADAELEELAIDAPCFSAEDHGRIEELLEGLGEAGEPTTLSALLTRARGVGFSPEQQRLLVLRVLGAFDPGAGAARLSVEPAGVALDDEHFFGDELRLGLRPSETELQR